MKKTMRRETGKTERALKKLRKAASHADILLEKAARKPLDRLAEANRARAMQDPEYAELMRQKEASGNRGTEWNTFLKLREIQEKYEKNPWWEDPTYSLTRSPLARGVSRVLHTYQRLTRGWADSSLYSLDSSLAETLGAQLLRLAEIGHVWPGEGSSWETAEAWTEDLTVQGHKLLAYAERWDLPAPENPEDKEAWTDFNLKNETLLTDAQDALRWVAKNLPYLWD